MRKCLVDYYIDPNTNKRMWSCNQGLTSSTHIATATRCWRHNCPGIRVVQENSPQECGYLNCTKPIRNSPKAKYCSLKCKSRESSRKYRIKIKNNA
jgi:hypothetical protein